MTALLLLVCFALLVAVLALAYDSALISHTHEQLRTGCEAGALAGASHLMDDSPLYPLALKTDGGGEKLRAALAARRVKAARQAAVEFAGLNYVTGKPLKLNPNRDNDHDGDVVVGWVDDTTVLESPFIPNQMPTSMNTMVVKLRRDQSQLPFSLSRYLGAATYDMHAGARATVEQRVYGFRPVGEVAVPMLPLLATPGGDTRRCLEGKPHDFDGRFDRFQVNRRTGEVSSGPDGVPELVFRICQRDEEKGRIYANARWFSLVEPVHPAQMRRQVLHGFRPRDLKYSGGQFALNRRGRAPVLLPPPSTISHQVMLSALREIKGQKRIVPWADAPPFGRRGSGRAKEHFVQGFSAARIVDCYNEDECLTLVVQPCLLQSCTALTRSHQPRNPWIGKLVLNR